MKVSYYKIHNMNTQELWFPIGCFHSIHKDLL